ncbi:MAG TPA: MFS transporter [Fimbriimonadaceae bacterium]|nr:MFS transporter [Fimbriimonadaceae bacterium]
MRRKLPPVLGIFLTVFIDLLSFGLVIPDIQLRGDSLGASGAMRGLLIASFSIAQLLTAPILGRWSDQIGRRKILLITCALAFLSNILYAHATIVWIMLAARVLLGIAGANLGVAYAYIADVTKPEDRAKSMGLIGAAFGLGFIFGPPVGALLIKAANGSPILLGYVAAVLSAINFIYIILFLDETVPKAESNERKPTLHNFAVAFKTPGLALLLVLFFVNNFGFANLESTWFLLAVKDFQMTQEHAAYVLAFVGVVSALMQGWIIRIVTPRFGEVKLYRFALLCQVPALALVPFAPPWIPMLLVIVLLGIGMGLGQPSLSSLISRMAPASMRGGVFGVTQGLGAMARILGPMIGNFLFDIRPYAPYMAAAGIVAIPMLGAWKIKEPEDE